MIFLNRFRLPTKEDEENFFYLRNMLNHNVYTSEYPFYLFSERRMPTLDFSDITVFYGNNGSGKSTVLNVVAEKLELPRATLYNRSKFFDDYVGLCEYVIENDISSESCIITSDDVFDKVLDIRRLNQGIDKRREALIDEFVAERKSEDPNVFTGMDNYDEWKRRSDMRRKSNTCSNFIRQNLIRNIQERSNGESALSYFVDKIQDGGLYLLDEPENSLSPQNQLQLKYFIEDCVRNHECQFIISTHSPFLLSLRRAKIYNLDSQPISLAKSWAELDEVRAYFDFFKENESLFI